MRSERLDLQPHFNGELVELRPLRANDWDGLFAAASDPMIWAMHPCHDRYQEDVFREYFREALESGGALVVVDRKSKKIIGSTRYFWPGPERNELEIGWTFLTIGAQFNRPTSGGEPMTKPILVRLLCWRVFGR